MTFGLSDLLHAVTYVSYHLTKALTAFIQRDSFLYWPFLASAAAIALIVAVYTRRNAAGSDDAAGSRTWYQRAKARWWHASARADYRLYFANALLLPVLFGFVLFNDVHVVNAIGRAFGTAGGTAADAAAPGVASRVVFTLLFFLAYDFGRFVAHSLLHEVPLLWEFHKVHHSAETLNPITTFRAHPVDLLVMAWVPALSTGLLTWTFNQVVSSPISAYTFLGLHVLIFTFNLVGLLRHTHVWVHYGPTLGRWFVSPAHHQIHHSCEANHLGCNRGFELALWDRLYGTLYVPGAREDFRMGLGDGTDPEWHHVRRMYTRPFVNAGARIAGFVRRRPVEAPVARSAGSDPDFRMGSDPDFREGRENRV